MRTVHVECQSPAEFRWLMAMLRNKPAVAEVLPNGTGVIVRDESRFMVLLTAASGKVVA